MEFLIDENLPLSFAKILEALGYPARHVIEVGLDETDDAIILNFARQHGKIIITFDLDFSRLIALGNLKLPSVITFRTDSLTAAMFEIVMERNLEKLHEALTKGAMVTITESNIRVKKLPVR
jgi:predicted nuclease of predicted toxin-antitoxin system